MNFYLNKYGFIDTQISQEPKTDLGIIVVIPCYNEPDLIQSLEALENCHKPECSVEVIVVLNSSEIEEQSVLDQNQTTSKKFLIWNVNRELDYFMIQQAALPKKHAGVGLARKIGMDEAVARFDDLNKDGLIVCFDADSKCDPNYLIEIEKHFEKYSKTPGCSIYFEHPIEGTEFEKEVYTGISHYELHLRYYKQCLDWSGLPYAYHTVGSSMAVRSYAYQKQGGMNKRKAGEDFYFIHKIIALGGFTELNSTRITPSPRSSDRVPFGTGRAIQEWLDDEAETYQTYNFQSFVQIKYFMGQLNSIYQGDLKGLDSLCLSFRAFLSQEQFQIKLEEIKSNTSDYESFKRRFFVWFDAFKVLKLVHFLRDNEFEDLPLEKCSNNLLFELNDREESPKNLLDKLLLFRKRDQSGH